MVEVRRIPCKTVNAYLVIDGKNAVLVDTGVKGFEKKIVDCCEGLHIRLIFLTHGHIDHIQNAAFLSKVLSAPIALSAADMELIRNNLARPLRSSSLMGKWMLRFSICNMREPQFRCRGIPPDPWDWMFHRPTCL